jgi:putative hydrolase of the HAD superfamily
VKYKAVIFDLFGTLVDTSSRESYYSTLSEMVSILKAPKDEFIKLWYETAEKRGNGQLQTLEENIEYICNRLKINPTKNQIMRAILARIDYVARSLVPKPESVETIAKLKSSGYKIGLISNCSPEPPIIWPKTLFAPYFDVTLFSSTCGLRKPDPRIYQLAAEKLSVKPEDCLYIGDGDGNELTGAAQAGMNPVLIRHSGENSVNSLHSEEYEASNWNGRVISSLKEVLNLLD